MHNLKGSIVVKHHLIKRALFDKLIFAKYFRDFKHIKNSQSPLR